jgi:hypothetical protein
MLLGLGSFFVLEIYRPDVLNRIQVVPLRCGFGFLSSCLLRWGYRRPFFFRRSLLCRISIVLGCSLGIALLEAFLQSIGMPRLQGILVPTPHSYLRLLGLRMVVVFLWSLMYFGLSAMIREQVLERRNLEVAAISRLSELRQLQAQINPHFLFNSLNAILAVRTDPVAVAEVTHSLSSFLRFSLHKVAVLEPLARELDALEHYLSIQKFRFGNDLICSLQCQPAARDFLAPPMLIQPLLENAIAYGKETSDGPLQIHISATLEREILLVTVANTGRWVAPGTLSSPGTGMDNLSRRLRLILGESATLTWESDATWVRVFVRIPKNASRQAGSGFSPFPV